MMADLADWTPRSDVEAVTLQGRHVTLEPLQPYLHGPGLWRSLGELQTNDVLTYFADGPFADETAFCEWLAEMPSRGWHTQLFRRRVDAGICGMASFMRTDRANGVTEIGAVVHGPSMARSPLSTEAHYLLARHVFETCRYRRYEWKCDNANAASKRTAERLGFVFEGVFRQHMVAKGRNRDTAWFSIIDKEWPRNRRAFEAWLAPSNFDDQGRQKQQLEIVREKIDDGQA